MLASTFGFGLFIALFAFSEATINCDDRPPKLFAFHQCCPMEIYPFNDTEIIQGCSKVEGETDNNPKRFFHDPCFFECMYSTAGLTNEEKEFDKEKIPNYVASYIPQTYQELVQSMLEKCNEHDNFRPRFRPPHPKKGAYPHPHHSPPHNGFGGDECSHLTQLMYMCLKLQLFANCPEELKVNSDECNNAREYVRECGED